MTYRDDIHPFPPIDPHGLYRLFVTLSVAALVAWWAFIGWGISVIVGWL